MKFAAFFRNLNLGHGNAPSRAALESAFVQAGADEAASFQTNGTVAFSARGVRPARKIARTVQQALATGHGFDEPVFVRTMAYLHTLMARDPFVGMDKAPPIYDFYVTFLHDDAKVLPALPTCNARRDVQVLLYTDAELLSLSHLTGKTPGNPNVFAEQLLGLPATTRTWGTVARLVRKFG
ncbi:MULTISPECIES: DUF1697 domain-containing protein [Acidovorax]|uniref:DUF1697 domain-containing protein n=1 Tax=Acidovorax TaxID=12916 RepID=UPI0002376969|nr:MULTISPECIES: DUF1697 domain-containing protein [Acidovorax]KRD18339.1 hypothetical protein ASE39_08720 [Acidovorax sp. Root267]